MWHKVRAALHSKSAPEAEEISSAEAVAAILVYTARLDDCYGVEERAQILELLERQAWDIETTPEALMLKAERLCAGVLDCHGFLRVLNSDFEDADRLELMRMMWAVVLVDDVLDEYEANMMRRIAGLLGISDADSGQIRLEVIDGI